MGVMVTSEKREQYKMQVKRYRAKYPHRVKAYDILRRSLRSETIKSPKRCFICCESNKRIIAHHENYALPLDVVWLCDACHGSRHQYLTSVDWVDYIEPPKKVFIKNKIQPSTEEILQGLFLQSKLSCREEEIVLLRAKGFKLREIGAITSLTGARIWQILHKSEQKLRKIC